MLNCMNADICLGSFDSAVVRIVLPRSAGKDHMPYKLILNVNGHSFLTPPVSAERITVLLC